MKFGLLTVSYDEGGLALDGDVVGHIPGVDKTEGHVTYKGGHLSGKLLISTEQVKKLIPNDAALELYQVHAVTAGTDGRSIVTVVPTSTVLSICTVPWCSSVRLRTSDSPMPLPSTLRPLLGLGGGFGLRGRRQSPFFRPGASASSGKGFFLSNRNTTPGAPKTSGRTRGCCRGLDQQVVSVSPSSL